MFFLFWGVVQPVPQQKQNPYNHSQGGQQHVVRTHHSEAHQGDGGAQQSGQMLFICLLYTSDAADE